jgi:phthiocerol/phenolphthiocerol synthesis type-I polyketide synthase E
MALQRSALGLGGDYEAPRSETERRLAEIWRASLDLDRVGIHDDYFWLRSGSLAAAMIFAEIERMLGVKLPMSTLVAAPTIAELARRIDATRT